MPELFQSMQAEYVRSHGVLPVHDGYDHKRQGQIYALVHVFRPKLQAASPAVLFGLMLLVRGFIWLRRYRKGADNLHR